MTLNGIALMYYIIIYCILRGRIKGFNSAIYIKCQQVVIELWLGSYRMIE